MIKGQDYDAKIDIWSLGVLIYEMAQNNPPYIEHPPLKVRCHKKKILLKNIILTFLLCIKY